MIDDPGLALYQSRISLPLPAVEGQVTDVVGMLVEGNAAGAALGDLYRLISRHRTVLAEVVALKGDTAVLVPYGQVAGLRAGDRMVSAGGAASIEVSDGMLGRVVDCLGNPLDNGPPLPRGERRLIYGEPLPPYQRRQIKERVSLGVRSLDAFVPCGVGQRLGIFAGAGVGKSQLLGMIARCAEADVVVLGLVGERGREVKDFVEGVLGEGMARSVVVCATSDRPPPERVRAAFLATTVAEYFRDEGKNVVLFVDSLTRFAMAQREVGLAVGEPPTTRGYPPSAFAMLPKLLERAAPSIEGGSITGLYTVLVEGDDMSDPVADTVMALLDGHIVLSRDLAARGHYPAVDVLKSLSRLENEVLSEEALKAARQVRAWLGRIEDARDLIAVGAYRPGSDVELDLALAQEGRIKAFLRQGLREYVDVNEGEKWILGLAQAASEGGNRRRGGEVKGGA
jgi:flagellum-specific ATP synthase